jgi:hypothetical protein
VPQCFCGKTLDNGAKKVAAADCSSVCPGGGLKTCGGNYRLSVYAVGEPRAAPARAVDRAGACRSVGCHTDAVQKRVLADRIPIANTSVSVQTCADVCRGYPYFGVEYGGEVRALAEVFLWGWRLTARTVLLWQHARCVEHEGQRDRVQCALPRRTDGAVRRSKPS